MGAINSTANKKTELDKDPKMQEGDQATGPANPKVPEDSQDQGQKVDEETNESKTNNMEGKGKSLLTYQPSKKSWMEKYWLPLLVVIVLIILVLAR